MSTPSKPVQSSVDRCSGQSTGNYDPLKDDFLHGRYTPSKAFFDNRLVGSIACCEACVFGEKYAHTCEKGAVAA